MFICCTEITPCAQVPYLKTSRARILSRAHLGTPGPYGQGLLPLHQPRQDASDHTILLTFCNPDAPWASLNFPVFCKICPELRAQGL